MKPSKPNQPTIAALRAGAISRDGFLGKDRRSLAAILKADQAAVSKRGLTHRQIARRMQRLRDAGLRGLGEFIAVAPHFEVRVDSARGKLPCPFGEVGSHRKTNTTVRNLAKGCEVAYSDLNIHLVEKHGFYEGRGSPFRVEPKALMEALEV